MGAVYWFGFGGGRRYIGVGIVLLGVLLLAGTIAAVYGSTASYGSNALASTFLVVGIAASVSVGWWGYRVQRRTPRSPPSDPMLAALAAPTPTARPLAPQDVQGQWRFYVDAAAGMVTVDLQADGRYSQVIAAISGERIDGPGGQWTLDRANLELSAYRSATRGASDRAGWFFGDCEGDLILFVKDDPEAKTMLMARRAEQDETPAEDASPGDTAALRATSLKRKANSRSPSLFVSYGRFGHGGKSAR